MVSAVEERLAEAVEEAVAGDDMTHMTCCRENVALCGADLTGWEDCDCDPRPEERCIRCDFIDEAELPCGAPFCRLRSWWRDRRSS